MTMLSKNDLGDIEGGVPLNEAWRLVYFTAEQIDLVHEAILAQRREAKMVAKFQPGEGLMRHRKLQRVLVQLQTARQTT